MNAIGGYFELELNKGSEFHDKAIKLNSGRNAFQYVLEAKKYEKVYLPYYTCDVLLEPINKLGLSFEYYLINENFEVDFDFSTLNSKQCFLYTNYFGLKDNYVRHLAAKCPNLIVDNAQAFYSAPIEGIDTFYSPRKFFGVPDGAYLYTNKLIERSLLQSRSFERASHLLIRSDLTAEDGYSAYLKNEKAFSTTDILLMSELTQNLLKSINYESVASNRRKNFSYLQSKLEKFNKIKIKIEDNQVPISYPFFSDDPDLRKRLIENRIYTPQYWTNVLETADKNTVEYNYSMNLLHLPIDQRLTTEDLDKIVSSISRSH